VTVALSLTVAVVVWPRSWLIGTRAAWLTGPA
jgi:hypothetical protein